MPAKTSTGLQSRSTAAMFETFVKAFVYALETYAGLGFIFASTFVWMGVQYVDSEARGAGVDFRLLILPGAVAFWPIFLHRWWRGSVDPPMEKNPHRLSNLR